MGRRVQLWIATLDVEKAFDRVHHSSLFDALLVEGVDASIFASLYRLYSELQASVVLWDGVESRSFQVQRGVRQGEDLSTLPLNLALNEVLEEVRAAWNRKGFGTVAGELPRKVRCTALALVDVTQYEVRNQIASRWRLFLSLRALLLNRRSEVKQRLGFCCATVGSFALRCANPGAQEPRVPAFEFKPPSDTVKILGAPHATDDECAEWIKRATQKT